MASIINHIQLSYHTLSSTEKRIADYVTMHTEELANIHIRDLAEKSNTSIATITRFCKKLGVKSFVDFKILLRDELVKNDASDHLIAEMAHMYKVIINGSNSLLSEAQIHQACALIENAERIEIYGIGSSALSGQDKFRLMRMGFRVDAHADSHTMLMNASLLGPADLVIAISNSGHTQDIIDAAALAKENKAKIMLLTNHESTPLSKLADFLLLSYSPKPFYSKGFLNAQLSILHILDLISMVLLKKKEREASRIKTLDALNQLKK
ncbi:LOW QUALITY PROTEIN: sialic acid utilization regulator, RpiR family [Bacillus sp. JCM 19046]|nr:LOW QUALITY PROTEIN: sialic acid utilization regulator, RpiR family [Bacillus sp. JCM 19045]GAF18046.1 LOW QUALITY PROTEIN: sialic acid utilization regulator, RpiR family [Bacillus sp. JCM 19046]